MSVYQLEFAKLITNRIKAPKKPYVSSEHYDITAEFLVENCAKNLNEVFNVKPNFNVYTYTLMGVTKRPIRNMFYHYIQHHRATIFSMVVDK